tara:strand:+ start:2839 stop:3099 length:261 start_codon:yes stop_codon:yes gene_type:complete
MNHITDTEAGFLWHTGCKSFLSNQPDRFEFLDEDEIAPDEGSLLWCNTTADALLLIEHYRSNGIKAFLLGDLSEDDGWCVHAEIEL